jgi:hypothetical protein
VNDARPGVPDSGSVLTPPTVWTPGSDLVEDAGGAQIEELRNRQADVSRVLTGEVDGHAHQPIGVRNGSGASTTAFTMVKSAVFAPMPSARSAPRPPKSRDRGGPCDGVRKS